MHQCLPLMVKEGLYVQRMLVKSTGEVREGSKTFAGDREVYLLEKAQQIIKETLEFRKKHGIEIADWDTTPEDKCVSPPSSFYIRFSKLGKASSPD